MNKTRIRCLSLALTIGVLALFGSGAASAQMHTTGLNVTKTCPMLPVAQGATYQCAFSVRNMDPDHGVTLTSVTNTFPWISAGNAGNGPAVAVPCLQGGSPVTVLGAGGSATAQCGGTATETAPIDCNQQSRYLIDRIAVTGTDQGPPPFTGLPATGSATNGPRVVPLQCDDNLYCTVDACVPTTGCTNTALNCGDSNLCTTDSCDEGNDTCVNIDACVTVVDPVVEIPGRMTGGGSVFTSAARVTHGFELHCDEADLPNTLEVNWGKGNNFDLEQLTSAICIDDPTIDQTPLNHSPFDTFSGNGIGRCNGVPGAAITFTFVDAGEPGKLDTATIEITGCPDGLLLSISGNLKKGNHQAHRP